MRNWLQAALICLTLVGAGCRSPQPPPAKSPAFFPPDRANARLQYLTEFASPTHFEKPPSRLLSFLVGDLPEKQPIIKPYGLALHDNQLLICDTMLGVVHQLDLTESTWTYLQPEGADGLKKPINIDVDANGRRYVADTGRGQVMIYQPDGTLVTTLGEAGKLKPTDVKIAHGKIYVTDLKQRAVHVFRLTDHQRLFSLPLQRDPKEESLFAPTNLAISTNGDIYVSDSNAFRVQHLDKDGHYVRSIGMHGNAPGRFARNKGLAIDRENRLYVVDAAFQNVQIFNSEGKLLLHFGDYSEPGEGAMSLPAGIIVDYDHLDYFRTFIAPGLELEYVVLVANQYGPHKVTAYGFIRKKA